MDGFTHILFVPLADRICNDHIRPERDANEQIDNQADQRAVCAHSRDGGGAVGSGKLPITALFSCRGKRRERYARRREPAYFSALPIQAAHGAGAGGREAAARSREAKDHTDRGGRSAAKTGRRDHHAAEKNGTGIERSFHADRRGSFHWRRSDSGFTAAMPQM